VKYILSAILAVILAPALAAAEPNCNETRWPVIDTTVKFGTKAEEALAAATKKYGAKAAVSKVGDHVLIAFRREHQDTFDNIAYAFKGGVVTRIVFSYSNTFQRTFGGVGHTLVALSKRLIDKVGEKADKAGMEDNGEFLARWDANNGVAMEVWGKDPDSAVVRFICESLELSVTRNLINGTNFGF